MLHPAPLPVSLSVPFIRRRFRRCRGPGGMRIRVSPVQRSLTGSADLVAISVVGRRLGLRWLCLGRLRAGRRVVRHVLLRLGGRAQLGGARVAQQVGARIGGRRRYRECYCGGGDQDRRSGSEQRPGCRAGFMGVLWSNGTTGGPLLPRWTATHPDSSCRFVEGSRAVALRSRKWSGSLLLILDIDAVDGAPVGKSDEVKGAEQVGSGAGARHREGHRCGAVAGRRMSILREISRG